jgi:hypothetical protein
VEEVEKGVRMERPLSDLERHHNVVEVGGIWEGVKTLGGKALSVSAWAVLSRLSDDSLVC